MDLICPHCDAEIDVPDSLGGQPATCPVCEKTFTAPLASSQHMKALRTVRKRVGPGGFFTFKKMITRPLVMVIYIVGVVLITWTGLAILFGARVYATDYDPFAGTGTEHRGWQIVDWLRLMLGFSIVLLGNIVWRVICEAWVVLFSIHDTLVSIDNELKKRR